MTARATGISEADSRCIVAEQLFLPDQVRGYAMLDLILRWAYLAVVEVRLRIERVGFETDEAVVGPELVDVLVGVTDIEVPESVSRIECLGQT
jgi:hypothetical protein